MKIKKILLLVVTLCLVGCIGYGIRRYFFPASTPTPLFKTQKAIKQSITKIINAEGSLEVIDSLCIGPLITGTVKKIHFKDGDVVKQGDLIMELVDDQRPEDLQVRERKGILEQAEAQAAYLEKNLERQRMIYEAKQLSDDEFESIIRNYHIAHAAVKEKRASYETARYFYEAIHVRAPHDGVIIAMFVTEGQSIGPNTQTTGYRLFEIAKKLDTLKAALLIDETKIGDLVLGQKVTLTVDTYPYKQWKGTISTVGNTPIRSDDGKVRYKAEVIIHDNERCLRPGMTIHAAITIAKAKDVPTIPGYVFYLNPAAIKIIAQQAKIEYKALSNEEKKQAKKDAAARPLQFLWILKNNTFTEVPVEVGVTNDSFYQIVSGIDENADILHDINEADVMKEFYAKQFGGGL